METDTTTTTATFTVGETYECRSACDHNSIFSYTVISRTAKFITIEDKFGKIKRVGVKVIDMGRGRRPAEWAMPEGSYSMAPTIEAR